MLNQKIPYILLFIVFLSIFVVLNDKNMAYRIKEDAGTFTIQKKVKETRGMLWWKHKVKVWTPLTFDGKLCYTSFLGPEGGVHSNYNSMGVYTSYKEAKKKAKKIRRGIKYHKV